MAFLLGAQFFENWQGSAWVPIIAVLRRKRNFPEKYFFRRSNFYQKDRRKEAVHCEIIDFAQKKRRYPLGNGTKCKKEQDI
jgi:hypothetical protein